MSQLETNDVAYSTHSWSTMWAARRNQLHTFWRKLSFFAEFYTTTDSMRLKVWLLLARIPTESGKLRRILVIFQSRKVWKKFFWSVSMEKKIIKSGKRPQKDLEKVCKKYGNLYSKLQRNLRWQNFISTRGMKPVLREIFLGYNGNPCFLI